MPSSSRTISISTGTIIRTILVLLALGTLWLIRDVVLYVFCAVLLAGVMYPFARWASKWHVPKALAVVVFYLILFGLIGSAVSLLIPALLDETRNLVSTYGSSVGGLSEVVNGLKQFSQHQILPQTLQTSLSGLTAQAQDAFSGLFNFLTNVFGGVAGVVIVFVLSFYLVVEDEAIKGWFKNLIPKDYQELVTGIMWQVMDKLGSWLRGQLLLGLIIGAMYFVALSLIGVPYALLLSIVGGLLEFIPYVGPFLSAVPVVVLAFGVSPFLALIALIAIIIIQQMEGHFIVPQVMKKSMGLNPIISVLAFVIGAKLFGVIGAIFSIPMAAAMSVALIEIMKFRSEQKD